MKNIVFGLLATILVSNFSFGQSDVKYSEYGTYHNECLTLYYEKQAGVKSKDFSQIIDDITILMQTKHPNMFKNVDNSKAKMLMSKYSIATFDFKAFWNTNKEDFYNNYGVSKRVGSISDDIINKNLNFSKSIELITAFKNQKDLTPDEAKGIEVMESILSSSNTYWNSNPTTKPGTKAIIADAIVGMVFCYTGPFAYFAGGAASVFVNETENQM